MVKIAGDDGTALERKRRDLWGIAMEVLEYLGEHGGSALMSNITRAVGLRRGATNAAIKRSLGIKQWKLGRTHPFYRVFTDLFRIEEKEGGGIIHVVEGDEAPAARAPRPRLRVKAPPIRPRLRVKRPPAPSGVVRP